MLFPQAKEIWGEDVDIEIAEGVSADDEDLNAMLMQGVTDAEIAKTQETVGGRTHPNYRPFNKDELGLTFL